MGSGQVISLFLIDGTPDGLLAGEIFNWTGKALKIPRRLLKEAKKREELRRTGIYFLFGRDDEFPEEDTPVLVTLNETLDGIPDLTG